jgi:transposase
LPRSEVVSTFGVSESSVRRWLRRQQSGKGLEAVSPPGRPRGIGEGRHTELWAQLERKPDATLAEHALLYNEAHGTSLSPRTVARAIARLGWTRKKRRWEPPSGTSEPGRSSGSG